MWDGIERNAAYDQKACTKKDARRCGLIGPYLPSPITPLIFYVGLQAKGLFRLDRIYMKLVEQHVIYSERGVHTG